MDRNVYEKSAAATWGGVALLAEGVDRNLLVSGRGGRTSLSPSSRRAWIEIYLNWLAGRYSIVALLAEGVDRNGMITVVTDVVRVALLAEGVDRNFYDAFHKNRAEVALLAEGVDRNQCQCKKCEAQMSRPPRGGRG